MLPKIYIKELGNRIETDGVEIISMGSISYERYREVAESLNKKVAVITDNDKVIKAYENTDLFRIFSDSDVNNWTLEVAFYNSNVDFFDELYKDKKNESNYKGEEMKKSCAYMLKNKSDNALLLEKHIYELEIPNYLKEAVKWIKE
ncbi:MAG: TOPRIM nucleotidyl transferase/hydrolase domain-containing protein [Streptococcus salivarius]